jgi:hypothetical protein
LQDRLSRVSVSQAKHKGWRISSIYCSPTFPGEGGETILLLRYEFFGLILPSYLAGQQYQHTQRNQLRRCGNAAVPSTHSSAFENPTQLNIAELQAQMRPERADHNGLRMVQNLPKGFSLSFFPQIVRRVHIHQIAPR